MKKERKSSPRLKRYPYSLAGGYFITICSFDKKCLFGRVIRGKMQLSNFGEIVLSVWEDLPIHYPNVQLDEFIIMPNHVHGIIFILDDIGRDRFRNLSLQGYPNPKFHGLSEIVRGFKTWSARQINTRRDMVGKSVWQRSFYDYIIREDEDLDQIRQYILGNPLIWEEDEEHPNRK